MKFKSFDIALGAFPVSILYEDAEKRNFRRCKNPDDDISDLPLDVQTSIRDHWESMGGKTAWDDFMKESLPPVTAEVIKEEAMRRILQVAPEWKQRNIIARGVELTLARAVNGSWTTEEATESAAIQAVWDWVKSVRTRSDELELTLPEDYTLDKHWPAKLSLA